MITRLLQAKINEYLFRGRIVTLFGARRVGKTTLAHALLTQHSDKRTRYLNCDLQSVQRGLSIPEAEPLKAFLGDYDLVVLDEAQNIEDAGRILNILVDTYPAMQVIATGSSSFDLANRTGEMLTGRVYPFILYPLSLQEIAGGAGYSAVEPKLEHLLRFGSYPSLLEVSEEEARLQLDELVSNYLYKDILTYAGIRKASLLADLLRLIALQVGNEVNYQELSTTLGIDRKTLINYLDLLEQSFVIFRLGAFSRNLRKEIARSQKVYFYDVGVRNAILQAFAPIGLRTDVGAVWENFCIVERIKYTAYNGLFANRYFWRTYDQKEIDYIEERDGQLYGYEFKWNSPRTMRVPREFLEAYPGSEVIQVDRDNYWKSLM